MSNPAVNPVGFLMEMCQKFGMAFPVFQELGSSGPSHCPHFKYKCLFEGIEVIATSENKKNAKRESAKKMVAELNLKGYFENIENASKDTDSKNASSTISKYDPLKNASSTTGKNPVSALQEYCQAHHTSLPDYIESTVSLNNFLCECNVLDKTTFGSGSSKKVAKTISAAKMCAELSIGFSSSELFLTNTEGDSTSAGLEDKNSVSKLNEFCQQRGLTVDFKEIINMEGVFGSKCTVDSLTSEGKGINKKEAKVAAANEMLKILGSSDLRGAASLLTPVHTPKCKNLPGELSLSSDEEDNHLHDKTNIKDVTEKISTLQIKEEAKEA